MLPQSSNLRTTCVEVGEGAPGPATQAKLRRPSELLSVMTPFNRLRSTLYSPAGHSFPAATKLKGTVRDVSANPGAAVRVTAARIADAAKIFVRIDDMGCMLLVEFADLS